MNLSPEPSFLESEPFFYKPYTALYKPHGFLIRPLGGGAREANPPVLSGELATAGSLCRVIRRKEAPNIVEGFMGLYLLRIRFWGILCYIS